MKKNIRIISTAILFTLMWLTPAWSVDQPQGGSSMSMPCPKMGKGMGGGMMGGKSMMQDKGMGMMHGKGMNMMHGKKSRCPNCPMGKGKAMMQSKKGRCPNCPMSKKGRMGMGRGMMREFHQWMKQFMAHRSLFDMNSEQMNQLDNVIMAHMKNAIQRKAEIRVQKVELRQMLRQSPMDLGAVENQIHQLSSLKADFQMEGIRLYSEVLNILTDQQKTKVEEIIGTPFPAPWEKMFPESGDSGSNGSEMQMKNLHEGHQMDGSDSEMESEDGPESAT